MKLAVLPGDDIGPEIMDATISVLRAADERFGLGLTLDVHDVGMSAHRRLGTTLPDPVIQATRDADGVLLGRAG